MTASPTAGTGPGHTGLRRFLHELKGRVASLGTLELVLPMTLVLMLFPGEGVLYPLVLALAVAGLVVPPLRRSAWLWFALAGVRSLDHVLTGWVLIDNHHFLTTYWSLVLGLTLRSRNPLETLAFNAKALIGLCFAFAGAWKVLGGEYADGSFISFLLLTEPGFSSMVPWITVPTEVIQSNLVALDAQASTVAAMDPVELDGFTPFLGLTAAVLGLWTIGIEFAVAAAFLLPLPRRHGAWRDVTLVLFVATTYLMAPVLTFGLLLLVMGFAQVEGAQVDRRTAYIAVFLVLPLAVYAVIGVPSLGFRLVGGVLVFGYLCGWGRSLLIAGLLTVGVGFGLEGGLGLSTWAAVPFWVGSALAFLSLLDLLFRRRTERPLLWIGGGALVLSLLLGGWSVPLALGVAVAGGATLALMSWISRTGSGNQCTSVKSNGLSELDQ